MASLKFTTTYFGSVVLVATLFFSSEQLMAQCNGIQVTQPATTCGGPGTEMTKIINRLGLGSDCGRCKSLAAQMDRCGVPWVEQNREYVVKQTISNAKNLGHRMGPVQRVGVRLILNQAIRRAQ